MDFFQQQDAARRNTTYLVVVFVVAVFAIIVALYVAIGAFAIYMASDGGPDPLSILLHPALLLGVPLGVITVVALGTGYKTAALAATGGAGVARSLGGRPLAPDTTDPVERRILNVVEEMSIASGVPVPDVYLLDDQAINAFAAGWRTDSAVVGVTRGAAERLTRDELQGVMAHEFSHVLNGDMRLNLRLIGVVHGILVIGLIGYYIMRMVASGSSNRRRSSNKDGGGNAGLALLALGGAIFVIGYAGVFAGRLIKAAVSRQREYLADASSVQFTRNPDGIGGALAKIGGAGTGSRLASPHVEQASHLLFAQGLNLSSLLATHPPLQERIRRVLPSWDGRFRESESQLASASPAQEEPLPDVGATLRDKIARARREARR